MFTAMAALIHNDAVAEYKAALPPTYGLYSSNVFPEQIFTNLACRSGCCAVASRFKTAA